MSIDKPKIRLELFDHNLVKETSDSFTMEESISEGYAKIEVHVKNYSILFEKVDKHVLEFLKLNNCPDFVLFEYKNGQWMPHIFEFKKTINKKNFEHSKLQFLGGIQNALAYAGVLGISLSLEKTILYSVYRNDNISSVSNPAKIRCGMHRHPEDGQQKADRKTEQEWDSGCANILFDEYSNFKLKKIKLDVESGEAEYSL
ncbi:MAG: hypothetical protein K2I03_11465 [Lachnospiraceae bacterium]|nr:hypothetical protein [Lachnospiraceae bacterium]